MRVYHLLTKEWALRAIKDRRLKLARFADLNDPFELLSANLKFKSDRQALLTLKAEADRKFGLACFSRGWESPLLWSHYGGRHTGLCLGFDVPDDQLIEVDYQENRVVVGRPPFGETDLKMLLATKYKDWAYEKEVRALADLRGLEPINGMYFEKFSFDLVFREVIVGALCNLSKTELVRELAGAGFEATTITMTKARLAFKSFKIAPDQRGLS